MSASDADQVRGVIGRYIEGSQRGDLGLVKSVFHPDARMSGFLQGNMMVGGPQPFYDAVASAPSPEKSGEPYRAQITHLDVAGRVASVTLTEGPYWGLHFTNYFHLIRAGSDWLIISKTFNHI